ncbi:50S ribosomal protein L23 [Corynebacterium urealyticum]|uniref:50S ribosomal protein L23 n=1 Tax=Corynebacterium urealyticum TaxID=43771 RepID=UPI0002B3F789|nr:50S ribosomal protein L23 [Corynebacterium urealyticum]AGE35906.1 50S ribosomal protein L23 [Corynebacterium urealyticum DSM 7111]QQB07613.1 50S ribosomal protein L23 [Corynebacterium urealyticum]TYR16880.1 50S ribosomal protein L23 [Corynebacterium urealyticum]TYT20180.1 50S ribosomal protein L23 [Corynebacterium urealyticum]
MSNKVVDPRDVIIAPVVSEKSYALMEQNVYTFLVAPTSNKTQIKIAVEQIFGVKVASVNTANREGKLKRSRYGYGRRKATKRAMVTLVAGSDPIDIFGGTVA